MTRLIPVATMELLRDPSKDMEEVRTNPWMLTSTLPCKFSRMTGMIGVGGFYREDCSLSSLIVVLLCELLCDFKFVRNGFLL